jgi:hypothetical protein
MQPCISSARTWSKLGHLKHGVVLPFSFAPSSNVAHVAPSRRYDHHCSFEMDRPVHSDLVTPASSRKPVAAANLLMASSIIDY